MKKLIITILCLLTLSACSTVEDSSQTTTTTSSTNDTSSSSIEDPSSIIVPPNVCGLGDDIENQINEYEHPILVKEYSNNAWEYKFETTFVTNKGNVFNWSNTDKDKSVDYDEIIKSKPIKTITNDEIRYLITLISGLEQKDLVTEHVAMDAGSTKIYAKDKEILLSVAGDSQGQRDDLVAKKILEFSESIFN